MDRILDEPALNLSQSLPDIAGKRLTLSFEPATDSDRQVIVRKRGQARFNF